MIRLGLVGAGRWGKNYIAAAKQMGNCVVSFVLDTEGWWGGEFLKREEGEYDAIVVATPPRVTAEIAIEVINHGYPVMIEKPVGLSVKDAQSVLDAEKWYDGADNKPVVLVNHQHLFAPAYEELYRRTKGMPHLQIATQGGDSQPVAHHAYPWLWDWAPHDVAMILDLGGTMEPELESTWSDDACVFARWRTARGSAFSHVGVNLQRKTRRLRVNDIGFGAVYNDRAEHKLIVNNQPVEVSPELPLSLIHI